MVFNFRITWARVALFLSRKIQESTFCVYMSLSCLLELLDRLLAGSEMKADELQPLVSESPCIPHDRSSMLSDILSAHSRLAMITLES